MSKFLAPIHDWLFNKIKVFEEIELKLISDLKTEQNIDIQDIVLEKREKYGGLIPNEPLENLIDTNNIHGWLQEKINIIETRQSAIITESIEKYGEKALETIKKSYASIGEKYGKIAKETIKITDAPTMYKVLNNYILEGMPCDHVDSIVEEKEESIIWNTTTCLHKKYWDKVKGNVALYYDLREIFITNFVKNANPDFSYTFEILNENNSVIMKHKISKK